MGRLRIPTWVWKPWNCPAAGDGRVLHPAAFCSSLTTVQLVLDINVPPPGRQSVDSITVCFQAGDQADDGYQHMKMVPEMWTDTQTHGHMNRGAEGRWSPSPRVSMEDAATERCLHRWRVKLLLLIPNRRRPGDQGSPGV